MRGGDIDIELMKFADFGIWTPKIGDVIFRDGMIIRWFAVVYGIDGDTLLIKKSGNLRLLVQGDYEEVKISVRKIKNTMVGSFSIISGNVYYV